MKARQGQTLKGITERKEEAKERELAENEVVIDIGGEKHVAELTHFELRLANDMADEILDRFKHLLELGLDEELCLNPWEEYRDIPNRYDDRLEAIVEKMKQQVWRQGTVSRLVGEPMIVNTPTRDAKGNPISKAKQDQQRHSEMKHE